MGFTAKHHVHHDGKEYEPGKPIAFKPEQLAEFAKHETGPIADLLAADAIEGELDDDGSASDLAGKSVEELTTIAAEEGVELPSKAAKAAIIAAIEAKRAADATA